MQQNEPKPDTFDILLRLGAFMLVAFVVRTVASAAMFQLDDIARSTLSTLLAGIAANWLLVHKFEQGRPADFGLRWPPRHLAAGFALGAAALIAVVLGAVGAGFATFEPSVSDRSIAPLALLLLAGALGEEMLFRGYAFQYLVREWSEPLTIAGSGILFGLVHLSNANVQLIGAANTALWGCLLGYAYTRVRSLWLPIAIHFGWNLALTLFTSNISGTTIRAADWDLRWSGGDLWSGGAYGVEGGLLTTIAALPVFLLVRRMR
jgi:membrane protease YdiL (CAAX protease family)